MFTVLVSFAFSSLFRLLTFTFHTKDAGPFASYDELTAWFAHKCEVNRRMKYTPPEHEAFDSSMPLVLTHMDFHPPNIIIDNDYHPWIIDWENAGFYPQWFQYTTMRYGWGILGRVTWRKWILGFVVGFYEKQAAFLAKINWAIDTGYLM
jgi:aminoglycoside phosphotransferase (APT) family kinase protein